MSKVFPDLEVVPKIML